MRYGLKTTGDLIVSNTRVCGKALVDFIHSSDVEGLNVNLGSDSDPNSHSKVYLHVRPADAQ